MERYSHFFYRYFLEIGASEQLATFLNMIALVVILAAIIFISDFITRKILVRAFTRFSKRSTTHFDDMLVDHKVPRNIAHLVPLYFTIKLFPIVFADFPQFERIFIIVLKVYGVLLTIWILRSLMRALESYFKTLPRLRDKPIDSYIQVVMLFVWIIGIASCLAIVINLSFLKFFTTLGAASAILLLIFKDTILGFVASIQVAINDTLRIGDWITMEKYGADGDVIEINLSTVQVQNFDMTITNIPTFAIISESFKNWRGMQSSGGRRIKRSILLKAHSIRYLSEGDVESLKQIQLITEYLNSKQREVSQHNSENNIDKNLLINGLNMTNLGVFRRYVQTYIEQHEKINKEMFIMVRQLAPSPHGIPMEIYAFSSDKVWVNYELIISDIFDHVLASVKYFDLEIYEMTNLSIKEKA